MQEMPETISSSSFILPFAIQQRKIKVINKLIVTAVLYGREAWSAISKDEVGRRRVLQKRALRISGRKRE